MRLRQASDRLLDCAKAPRRWWWPDYVRQEDTPKPAETRDLAQRPPEEMHLTIRRVMLTTVAYGCFCLFTLGAPDKSLLENRIDVPFADVDVDFFDFLTVGPAILIGLTVYLQIFVGYWRASRISNERGLSFLFNMPGVVPRLLSNFLFYWLPPVVLAAFSYKAAPYSDSTVLPLLTLSSIAVLVFLQIRRAPPQRRKSVWYRTMWLVFSLTSLFVIAASANRLGQVNYMAIGKKAGQATRSLTTSGLAMVGIELLRLVQVGHVTTIEGTVTVKRAGGETVQLGSESPIYEKDLVKTGPEGAVTLVFADGSKLSLTSNSSLVLEERTEAGLPGGLLQGRTVRFVTGPSQTRSVLRGLDLAGADLTTTSLGRRSLRDADLRKANLSGVNLSSRDLRGAFLEGANLINAKLMGANLTNANLSKADLTGANLGNARLEHSDLRGAELVGANLATTRLFKTLFAGANLKNAKLDGADLRDANLKEAENLTQGQLDVACGNQNTELPMGLKIKDCPGFVPFKLETPHITAGVRG